MCTVRTGSAERAWWILYVGEQLGLSSTFSGNEVFLILLGAPCVVFMSVRHRKLCFSLVGLQPGRGAGLHSALLSSPGCGPHAFLLAFILQRALVFSKVGRWLPGEGDASVFPRFSPLIIWHHCRVLK